MQNCLLFGEILTASTTKCVWETSAWPRIELGYGNNVRGLDDPHGYNLKTLSLVYGWPSETDPQLLDNEDLSSLNPVKIQSIPLGKLRGIEIPIKHRIHYKNPKNQIKMFYQKVKHFWKLRKM